MNGSDLNGNNDRELRNAGHQKQNRTQIQQGPPDVSEISEGVPVLRAVAGVGIVEYVKYNGELYASHYPKYTRLPNSKGEQKISKFHDNVATGVMGEAWDTIFGITDAAYGQEIGGQWEDTSQDTASLVRKVNEIITVLRFSGILKDGHKAYERGS